MNVTITFRHLEHTEALDDMIHAKSGHLQKYLENEDAKLHWRCKVEHGTHYTDLQVIDNGNEYVAHAEADDLYKCLDLATQRMGRQFRKHLTQEHNKHIGK